MIYFVELEITNRITNNMNKKLSATMLIFYTFLISIFNIFDVEAQAITVTIKNSHPVKDFNVIAENFILWILSIAGTLILLVLIFNLVAYLFYIVNCILNKNNGHKEKLAKTKKRILQFLKILILIFVLYMFFDNFTKPLLDLLR